MALTGHGFGAMAIAEIHTSAGTAPTRDTTVKRTGAASWKCDSGAGNSVSAFELDAQDTSFGASTQHYLRYYIMVNSLPSSTVRIMRFGDAGAGPSIRLTSGGKLQLWNEDAGTQIGSDSAATVSINTWYRLELNVSNAGISTLTATEARVDGVTIASTSGLSIAIGASSAWVGWIDAPGASKVMNVDDFAWNDNSGTVNTSWPGAGGCVLMLPTADSQRGSWTGGAGGTTNLFDALNNNPPIGTATETDLTQIESIDSSGDNATDEYRGNMGTYTAGGVPSGATIDAIIAFCTHGEDVSTNTKTGSFGFQSNPSATYGTFTFGDDFGALGTYPTNWSSTFLRWEATSQPTLGSSLIMAIRKTDSGTRVASAAFLCGYVGYTEAAAAATPTLLYPQARLATPGSLYAR